MAEINLQEEQAANLEYITRARALIESVEKYGKGWQGYDYKARRSSIAGDLCDAQTAAARYQSKAERRPGSIGARKARRKARKLRRLVRTLAQDIKLPLEEYQPTTPEYMAEQLYCGVLPKSEALRVIRCAPPCNR